jgi:tetratricopeptide (TPR) repeat protein
MSTQAVFLVADIPQSRTSPRKLADKTLNAAAAFWFVVAVLGQVVFAFTVASFYGLSAARGNWQRWNKVMTHGYAAEHPVGNLVVAIHLVSAVIILLSGAAQLIPQFRRRAPGFHRWNGRVYMVTAFTVSLAGLYMMWIRGSAGDLAQHVGQSLDGVLIMVCSVLALRYAASPATYNLDEEELNALGYELIRARKIDQAIRIFQLNVEAYLQSGNVYDSLGEGYTDANDKPHAIANYQKSLQLNPKNTGAVKMLQLLRK